MQKTTLLLIVLLTSCAASEPAPTAEKSQQAPTPVASSETAEPASEGQAITDATMVTVNAKVLLATLQFLKRQEAVVLYEALSKAQIVPDVGAE